MVRINRTTSGLPQLNGLSDLRCSSTINQNQFATSPEVTTTRCCITRKGQVRLLILDKDLVPSKRILYGSITDPNPNVEPTITGQEAWFNKDVRVYEDLYVYGNLYYNFDGTDSLILIT